jgi:uncharacterized repeat protein (TIGR01451 family)
MRRIYALAGLAVMTAGLAGWAALAWAQADLGDKLPPSDSQLIDPGPAVNPVGAPTEPSPLPPNPSAVSLPKPAKQPMKQVQPEPVDLPPLPDVAPAANDKTPEPYQPPAQTKPITPKPIATQPVEKIEKLEKIEKQPVVVEDKATDANAGATPKNPTGRQEPAVSLEWVGPITAKVGVAQDYSIAVKNACNIAVQQVMVRVRIPKDMTVKATEPNAVSEANVYMWELGTLQPQQEKILQMKLIADGRGDMAPQAWVTFTGSSVMRISVREPKLSVKASAPEKVLVGDAATFMLTVSNPGDGVAEQVKVHAQLSEGLEHAKGNKVDFEIGNLSPGESRSVQLICATKTGGEQKCDAQAEAEGGLKGQDMALTNVIMPRLDLAIAGPGLRYLDRKATYTLKVTNPGDAPATNVSVADVVPAGFKFLSATDGGRHDFSTRTVSWFVGEVGPGQTKEVKFEVVAVNPGEFHHKASAQAARGLKTETELLSRVEGLSAILLEVVDTEDPIEVGGDTAYEIRITNTGSKTETDIKLVCTIPEKMEFKNSQGPCKSHAEGKVIVFDALAKLAPRADAIFRVNVKALQPGDVRFKAQITSTNLVEPVLEMEATRIYSDAPDGK